MNLVLFWFVILNDSVWIPTHKPVFESHICVETLQPCLSLSLFSSSCFCSPSFMVTVWRGNQAAVSWRTAFRMTEDKRHTRFCMYESLPQKNRGKDRSSISIWEWDEMAGPFSLSLSLCPLLKDGFWCSESCGCFKELHFLLTLSVRSHHKNIQLNLR